MIELKKNTRVLIVIGMILTQFAYGQKKSEKFEFRFENKTFQGLIESPINEKPNAIIIIIPGDG